MVDNHIDAKMHFCHLKSVTPTSTMVVYPTKAFLIITSIELFSCIINGRIFFKECTSLKSKESKFSTKYLKYLSFLSLSSGFFFSMLSLISRLPYTCYAAGSLSLSAFWSQGIFLGLYQLARLYYCFAKSSIHSDEGYSNYIFIIFGIIGIILLIHIMVCPWYHFPIVIDCGMDEHGQYYSEYTYIYPNTSARDIWHTSIVALYFLWDTLTLILYVHKIRTFSKNKINSNMDEQRISFIMYRILICTLFYQITGFIITAGNIIGHRVIVYKDFATDQIVYSIELLLYTILWTYSLYLMQEHNGKKYTYFIGICRKMFCMKESTLSMHAEGTEDVEMETTDHETTTTKTEDLYPTIKSDIGGVHPEPTNYKTHRTSISGNSHSG